MSKILRRVKVMMKSPRRGMSVEVFAEKDPVRAAKRFAKKLGFDIANFDWRTAEVLEGPDPKPPPELDAFEEDLLLATLTGKIETR